MSLSDREVMLIIILIVVLLVVMIISSVHKMYVFYGSKISRKKKHRPDWYCVPVAKSLRLVKVSTFDSNNNLITTFKGNIMSVSLVGKQTVQGKVIPIDGSGNPIDLTKWPLDQILIPGSQLTSSGDLSLFSVTIDPNDPLTVVVVSVGDTAGTANMTYLARNINNESISLEEPVTVTVPEQTTTTSTSTSSTTTEAPETAPLATGFQLNWGTPTDVVG